MKIVNQNKFSPALGIALMYEAWAFSSVIPLSSSFEAKKKHNRISATWAAVNLLQPGAQRIKHTDSLREIHRFIWAI